MYHIISLVWGKNFTNPTYLVSFKIFDIYFSSNKKFAEQNIFTIFHNLL